MMDRVDGMTLGWLLGPARLTVGQDRPWGDVHQLHLNPGDAAGKSRVGLVIILDL
jgi:hypothetical protein